MNMGPPVWMSRVSKIMMMMIILFCTYGAMVTMEQSFLYRFFYIVSKSRCDHSCAVQGSTKPFSRALLAVRGTVTKEQWALIGYCLFTLSWLGQFGQTMGTGHRPLLFWRNEKFFFIFFCAQKTQHLLNKCSKSQ
jgi:hypothetical protein